jgi:hypothetical protein
LKIAKRLVFKAFDRFLQTATARESLRRHGKDRLREAPRDGLYLDEFPQPPEYAFLPNTESLRAKTAAIKRPIFITARFRSGSTFLWQLFRQFEGITAFYEPLNESHWTAETSEKTDPTHIGVDSYTSEYQGLNHLAPLFDRTWSFRRLYLDEKDNEPQLAEYIGALIDAAPGRALLQFNRADFRLAWLRAHFPEAHILHLYRDPREQWVSIIRKSKQTLALDLQGWGPEQGKDLFYTYEWCRDLQGVFPILDPLQKEHPYFFHYALWRLSYLFGARLSDVSIGYESLIENMEATLGPSLKLLGIPTTDLKSLRAINRGRLDRRSAEYAPDNWYADIEARCEFRIRAYFVKSPLWGNQPHRSTEPTEDI